MVKWFTLVMLIFLVLSNSSSSYLNWENATEKEQLDQCFSSSVPVLFFKHSYKCGLSMMVLNDFENQWDLPPSKCRIVFIDIWKNRAVSNYLSEITGIRHHSPQVLVIRNKRVIYHETHGEIKANHVKKILLN